MPAGKQLSDVDMPSVITYEESFGATRRATVLPAEVQAARQ